MRLRSEIFDRIGPAEFQWNQVIDLVIAGAVRGYAIFAVNLPLHFLRNVAHFLRVSSRADILCCDIERAAGGQIRIWEELAWAVGRREPGRETPEKRRLVKCTLANSSAYSHPNLHRGKMKSCPTSHSLFLEAHDLNEADQVADAEMQILTRPSTKGHPRRHQSAQRSRI